MNHTLHRNHGLPATRRDFLKNSSACGVALAAGSLAARAAEAAPTPRKLKLGVIGCGGRGGWIAGLFRDHGGYQIHAVADYFPEVAEAAGNAPGVEQARRFAGLSGFRRLIDSGVEAVVLETPPWFFPEHVQAAVDARLHVFMAKAVAVDVPGCLAVEAAAAKATAGKRCFLIDYQMPTDPHVLECAKRFREGGVPELSVAKSFYCGGQFDDPPRTATIESRLRSLVWVNDLTIDDLYRAGAVRNIAAFHQQVTTGDCTNSTVPMAVGSCLATILGREACLRKGRLTMADLRRENRRLELDLGGLKA